MEEKVENQDRVGLGQTIATIAEKVKSDGSTIKHRHHNFKGFIPLLELERRTPTRRFREDFSKLLHRAKIVILFLEVSICTELRRRRRHHHQDVQERLGHHRRRLQEAVLCHPQHMIIQDKEGMQSYNKYCRVSLPYTCSCPREKINV